MFLDQTYHNKEVLEIVSELELIRIFESPIMD